MPWYASPVRKMDFMEQCNEEPFKSFKWESDMNRYAVPKEKKSRGHIVVIHYY